MIPKSGEFINELKQAPQNYGKTYKLDLQNKIISGFTDELEAIEQSVYAILNTERYEHLIYSFDYGVELQDLVGEDMVYVKADIHRRIEEALTQDDRILSVDDPQISSEGDSLHYSATVNTIYGQLDVEKEVTT